MRSANAGGFELQMVMTLACNTISARVSNRNEPSPSSTACRWLHRYPAASATASVSSNRTRLYRHVLARINAYWDRGNALFPLNLWTHLQLPRVLPLHPPTHIVLPPHIFSQCSRTFVAGEVVVKWPLWSPFPYIVYMQSPIVYTHTLTRLCVTR